MARSVPAPTSSRLASLGGAALLAALLASSLAAGAPTPSGAPGEATPAALAEARDAFQRALRLYDEERWAEASELLERALQVKETPGLRYHLGHCAEQQGLLLEALQHYSRSQALITAGAEASDVQALLPPAVARVLAQLALLRLRVTPAAEYVVYLGDQRAPSGPELPLAPGAHVVRIEAPGFLPWQRELTAQAGERLAWDVQLQPVPAAPAAPSAPPRHGGAPPPRAAAAETGWPWRTTALIGSAGVVVVGGGLAVLGGVRRSHAATDVTAAQQRVDTLGAGAPQPCHAPTAALASPCRDLATAADDRDAATQLLTAGVITAAAGAVATAGVIWLWPTARPSAGAYAPRVHVGATPSGGWLHLQAHF